MTRARPASGPCGDLAARVPQASFFKATGIAALRVLLAAMLALVCPLAVIAGAPDLPGQAAPAFHAAVQSWLDDDEAAALPALAALAQAGNPSAQLLLAVIDKTPPLQGPWLSKRDRASRIALMRAPGGMSGTSWIDASAQSVPVAGLMRAMWRVDTAPHVALDLARAGEARAAREALVAMAARERRGLGALLDDPDYPSAMRWLGWRELDDPASMSAAVDVLHPGDPQRQLMGRMIAPEDRADWLLGAPEATPIATFCRTACADTMRACALALDTALGSVQGLLTFGSPSATLIPEDAFAASARGQSALLRRVLLAADARGRRALLARATETDACVGSALHAEAERYRYVRAPLQAAD